MKTMSALFFSLALAGAQMVRLVGGEEPTAPRRGLSPDSATPLPTDQPDSGFEDDAASSDAASGDAVLDNADEGRIDSGANTSDSDVHADPDAIAESDAAAEPDGNAPDAIRPEPTDGGLVCGEFEALAEGAARPVDIVWVVDGSPSMGEEIAHIEANLNAWAARIGDSGLDYRVVLIGADEEYCADGRCYFEICVPPPLSGAAGCPDQDGPRFRHVRQGVHSREALDVAAETIESWTGFLRPGAMLHIVAVTDDDQGWGLDPDEFLAAIGPHIAPHELKFHSIVDEVGRLPSCGLFGEPECSCGESAGRAYMELSTRTGGLVQSVCEPDWEPVFAALQTAVVEGAGIPCAFDLPNLPRGIEFDADRVNVDVVIAGQPLLLDNVGWAEECGDEAGWHYDDVGNPTQMVLCPAACEGAQSVNVEFGCEQRKR